LSRNHSLAWQNQVFSLTPSIFLPESMAICLGQTWTPTPMARRSPFSFSVAHPSAAV
jgi:hypothetical protein